jgi:hypothetical protein
MRFGKLERKIVALLRYGRRPQPLTAIDIAERAYPEEHGSYRAEHVAVLRAMGSVARKYPDKFVLRGGKGRAPLVIMPAKHAPAWDDEHTPRRRGRTAAALPDGAAQARIRELEAQLADLVAADKRLRAAATKYMAAMKQRIEELEALAAITAKRGQPELFAHTKRTQYALALYDLLSTYAATRRRQPKQRRKP